jgi:hypothetical protein
MEIYYYNWVSLQADAHAYIDLAFLQNCCQVLIQPFSFAYIFNLGLAP